MQPATSAQPGSAGIPAFRGGVILAIASFAIFLSGPAQTHGVSVFIDPILTEFGWSRSLVSTMFSVATLLSAIPLVIVGRQIDRVGSRTIMVASAVFYALALFGLSRIGSPLGLLIGFTALRTFGSGILMLAARTLIPHWFATRRGRAFSILGLAAALNLAIVPRANETLISWVGWRDAWNIVALVILIGLTPAIWLLVRSRPEDVGEHPDGIPPGQQTEARSLLADSYVDWTIGEAMRTRAFWALQIAGAVPALVLTGVAFHQTSIMEARDLPGSLASTAFAVESAVALPLTLCAGWLVDRFATRYVLAVAQVILAVALVVVLLADSIPIALLYAAIRGAGMATWQVAGDAGWPSYFGRRNLGMIRGVSFATSIVGAAIGPLPLGIVFDMTGSYQIGIAAFAVLPVATAMFVLFAQPPNKSQLRRS